MLVYCVIITFFTAILIIGFSNKKESSINEYIYSGRRVTTPALIATLVTSWYGAINEVGIEVINYGIVTWIYFGLVYYISAFIYAYVIAPKIIKNNYQSIPITIYKHYGKFAGLISLTSILFYLIPASYLIILSQIINQIFNFNYIYISTFIALSVSTIYILKGGFNSIIKTDKIQFVLMFFGFLILIINLFYSDKFGFIVLENLFNRKPEMFSVPGDRNWSFIGMFALLSFATFIDPIFHQRTFSGKNLKTVQKSILFSIFFWFLFDFMTITSALFYYEICYMENVDISQISSPYIHLAQIVFNNQPILISIFFMSLLSVVMSTIDSYTFLSSVTLKYDLNTILNKKTSIQDIRKTSIIILCFTFLLSTIFTRAINYWYYFGTFMIVVNLIPMLSILSGIKIKNMTIVMISSIVTTLGWKFLIFYQLTELPAIYIGLSTGLIFFYLQHKINENTMK